MPFVPQKPPTPEEEEQAKRERMKQDLLDYRRAYHSPVSPLHENLRTLRINRQLKKQDMADLMGITPRTYYTYESGARPVPSNSLARLATMIDVDLDMLLMGRSLKPTPQIIESAIDDLMKILEFLDREYPTMDWKTRMKVARHAVMADTGDWPRVDPEMIRGSVKVLTRYKFHPENLPQPPNPDDYRDDDRPHGYERDMTAWQAIVDEDLGGDT